MSLPLRGWPGQVLVELETLVDGAAQHAGVHAFKIGRTNDPAGRESDYRRDYDLPLSRLVALYRTDSVYHALLVEGELIAAFMTHPKCLNKAGHAGGNVSPDDVQYVYLALWERATS